MIDSKNNQNILYVISLPIGNISDITYRAVDALQKVNVIYCEDTRQFEKYKYKFNINCKIDSYYDHNERYKTIEIINYFNKNTNVSVGLVSDGGTPMISDPGYHLIKAAYENNIKVVPIPGVSAITCGLSVCPFNNNDFRFIGFFKESHMEIIKNAPYSIMFFESPKRIIKTLNFLKSQFDNNSNNNRKIFIGREMTKTYQQYYLFNINEIPNIEELGEFIVIIEGNQSKNLIVNQLNFQNVNKLIYTVDKNMSIKSLSIIIAHILNIKKNQVYKKFLENK
jgi:16S rRNA (cytidine1402-2'-O)-methyltransferase